MPLFAATIFLSAFLLFQVQPLIGRVVLPWFGGTPAVWTTCMLFFQALLLVGYGYSHALTRRLRIGQQLRVHVGLLLLALLALGATAFAWDAPMVPGRDWRPPDSAMPTWRVLELLALSVGLPYFAVSTTGPLLQAWFHRAFPERPVYRLYALSNFGSLLALVSYPFLIEPQLALRAQTRLWALGFAIFAAGCTAAAIAVARRARPAEEAAADASAPDEGERPGWRRFSLWTLLAACASVMLLAVTNQLCQEIAVIPFLWIAPLVIYLLSFILTFESERWYTRPRFVAALAASTLLVAAVMLLGRQTNLLLQVIAYLFVLFASAMVCHGELARLKPAPRHLTGFYLALALGGALGGLFIGLAAPRIFRAFWELHLGLWCTWLLLLAVLGADRHSALWGRHSRLARTSLALAVVLLLVFLVDDARKPLQSARWISRNFYGVLAVDEVDSPQEPSHRFRMRHGRTTHGFQYDQEPLRSQPTAYYGPDSGVGMALLHHPRKPGKGLRVGAVGLGIGTIAAFGQPGDTYRFYEINPDVIRIAQGEGGFFSYLKDSKAKVEVVEGDARVSMERELEAGALADYDLIVLDAFSSDSIPIHLLTREAFALYLERLAPGGVLAIHVSNLFLELRPVVWRLADAHGLEAASIFSEGTITPWRTEKDLSANWMLLSRGILEDPSIVLANEGTPRLPPAPVWTDDFSNLFETVELSGDLVIR